MFNIALSIFVFLSPIFFLPLSIPNIASLQFFQFGYFSNSINLVQLQIFQYSVVALFICSLICKAQRNLKDKTLFALFMIFFINVYCHPKSIDFFINIFLGFLLYYLVYVYTNINFIKSIFKIIFVVSLTNTVFEILQYFNIHILYRYKGEIIGLMNYKTQMGIYQAIAIPICYAINPFLSIIPLTGLILSKSATALIPAIVGMIYFFRKNIMRIQSPVIWMSCITIFGVILIKFFYHFTLRFEVWVHTFKKILHSPIDGYGVGTFNYISNKVNPVQYSDPYSLYLELAYFLGIPGLIALIFFIKDKFSFSPNNKYVNALISSCLILLVAGLAYSFMDYARLAGTAIILFALLNIVKGENYYVN